MGRQHQRRLAGAGWWVGSAVAALAAASGVLVARSDVRSSTANGGAALPVANYKGPHGFIVYSQMTLSGDGEPRITRQDGLVNATKRYELFQQVLPGGQPMLLTDSQHRPTSLGDSVSYPAINASGRLVAFQGDKVRDGEPPVSWLWVMDLKTRTIRPLPYVPHGNEGYSEGPTFSWSPDGKTLALALPFPIDYSNPDVIPPPPTAVLVVWDIARNQVIPVSKKALWEAWNWVGNRLVYFENGRIMAASLHLCSDGESVRRARYAFQFPPTKAVDFSPDGLKAVLVREIGGFSIIHRGRKREHSIPYYPQGILGLGITGIRRHFLWSPDSRYLAYTGVVSSYRAHEWAYMAGIWDTHKRQDQKLDKWDATGYYTEGSRQPMGWSQDQSWLLFQGSEDMGQTPDIRSVNEIWAYHVATKSKTVLWQDEIPVSWMAWHEGPPPAPAP